MGLLSSFFGSFNIKNNENNNNNDSLLFDINATANDNQSRFGNLLSELSYNQLPINFQVRRLEFDDYEKGYVELLSQLTSAGPMTCDQFQVFFTLKLKFFFFLNLNLQFL